MAKSPDRLLFFSCFKCWYQSVASNSLLVPEFMAAAGPLCSQCWHWAVVCQPEKMHSLKIRYLGRASVNNAAFIPNWPPGNH